MGRRTGLRFASRSLHPGVRATLIHTRLQAGGGYFIFRNSWGPNWGDHGYGYMPFHYVKSYCNDMVAYKP